MRTALLVLLLSAANLVAARNDLKPSDFEPLTSLPWKKPNATFDETLEAIYREPNLNIRYPVLAEYLRAIPADQLSRAFDKCTALECSQTPDELVGFFLQIWASRDPRTCWMRTKALFHVVGFEDGWMNYKAEKDRERPTVQDSSALQASRFWLTSNALCGFPAGVDNSPLPAKERVELMRAYADKWFDAFGCWPGSGGGYSLNSIDFDSVCSMNLEELRNYFTSVHPDTDDLAAEVARRRWLEDEPSAAAKIIQQARETQWQTSTDGTEYRSKGPSIELLMLWAKIDQAGMVRWADPLDVRKDNVALKAKGLLMSRVDPDTRKRWLDGAKSANPNDDFPGQLFREWAAWDPISAFNAAVATNDPDVIVYAGIGAAYGPFNDSQRFNAPYNSSGFGLGVLKNFDAAGLPPKIRHSVAYAWEGVMEQWGSIDIGEAARYGLDFILRTQYVQRDKLLRYFRGEQVPLGDDGMIDRTFCALRVWAVFHPKEMTAWIKTLNDPEMQNSLMWLLKHAQGTWPAN